MSDDPFASVNHLHFQMSLRERPLPIAASRWEHNGGNARYPSTCRVAAESTAAWREILRCHDTGTPYNLIYEPDRMLCLPRRRQGSYVTENWYVVFRRSPSAI